MKPILLVEDNADDEALTLRAFQKHDIRNRIIVARDGVEALEYLLAAGTDSDKPMPQVVLLDLKLPKIDGLEVLKRVRENAATAFLPVVILTSSKEQQDIIAGYRLRCNSYVRKPVDFDQFMDAAKQLGLYWLLLNEPPA